MSQKKLSAFFKPLNKTPFKEMARNPNAPPKRESTHSANEFQGEAAPQKAKIPRVESKSTCDPGTTELPATENKLPSADNEGAAKMGDENTPVKSFQPTLDFKPANNEDITGEIAEMATRLPVLDAKIGPSWFRALKSEFKKPYFERLSHFVTQERQKAEVYPPHEKVWTWTKECSLDNIKVVILGQDPYHNPGQAHGLCFSVQVPVPPPPSLLNMYKELATDIEGFTPPKHGYLVGWARQGVLLLNACLTVRKNQPNSHKDQGWENLTTAVIKYLNEHKSGIVFLLWGAYAQKKADFVNKKKHCVLKTVHPSPLSASRGWFGNKHFSKCNEYLKSIGKRPIDWCRLPEK